MSPRSGLLFQEKVLCPSPITVSIWCGEAEEREGWASWPRSQRLHSPLAAMSPCLHVTHHGSSLASSSGLWAHGASSRGPRWTLEEAHVQFQAWEAIPLAFSARSRALRS